VLAHCRGRKLRRAKEVGGQKSEVRCQEKTEVGGQRSKDRGQTAEFDAGRERFRECTEHWGYENDRCQQV
jgi:hypothetical protein